MYKALHKLEGKYYAIKKIDVQLQKNENLRDSFFSREVGSVSLNGNAFLVLLPCDVNMSSSDAQLNLYFRDVTGVYDVTSDLRLLSMSCLIFEGLRGVLGWGRKSIR